MVVGCRDKFLYCLERETGELWWAFATRGDVDASPVVAKGLVVAASNDGRLYGVSFDEVKKFGSTM